MTIPKVGNIAECSVKMACKLINAKPEETLFIGDDLKDLQAGQSVQHAHYWSPEKAASIASIAASLSMITSMRSSSCFSSALVLC